MKNINLALFSCLVFTFGGDAYGDRTSDDGGTGAPGDETVQYTLRFDEAQNHYIEVEAVFPAVAQKPLEITMAVWTPGSYLVREYARHVEGLRAETEKADSLPVRKIGKNRWVIDSGEQNQVRISYRIYCREMTVRTNWVERDFAVINGAPTFITPAEKSAVEHRVKLVLPAAWKSSATSLEPIGNQPHCYSAADLDELIDSPILAGKVSLYPFRVGGRDHFLANLGDEEFWDGPAAARDLARIVELQQNLWGTTPYRRYFFLNVISEASGGLEHDNSTLMMTSRWSFRDRKRYLSWLGLASHEFFHTWNVRRLRPKGLLQYDYQKENYTPSLWIAEGITSYYDDLCLVRAGLCQESEYLELLSKQIRLLQTTPGRKIQSLHDASFDTWIKFYRPDENSTNSRISYYTKGAVAAFLLDARIRKQTDGQKSLDDVIRILYERHHGAIGYTPEDFRKIVAEVTSADQSDWFQVALESTAPLDYTAALDWFGLAFQTTPDKPKPSQAGTESTAKAHLGVVTSVAHGRLTVSRVVRDSPAARGGLNVGDELLAIAGYRVTADTWQERLGQFRPDEEIELLIARRERLVKLRITLGSKPKATWKLKVRDKPDEQQKRRLANWLGTS